MNELRTKFKSNKGFTMVELLIASAILTIIMVPLMNAFSIAANNLSRTTKYNTVSVAVENVTEIVRGSTMDNFESALENLAPDSSTINVVDKSAEGYLPPAGTINDDYTLITALRNDTKFESWQRVTGFEIGGLDAVLDVISIEAEEVYFDGGAATLNDVDATLVQIMGDVEGNPDRKAKDDLNVGSNVVGREIAIRIIGAGTDDDGNAQIRCDIDYKYTSGGSVETYNPFDTVMISAGADGVFILQLIYGCLENSFSGTNNTDLISITNETSFDVEFYLFEGSSGTTGGSRTAKMKLVGDFIRIYANLPDDTDVDDNGSNKELSDLYSDFSGLDMPVYTNYKIYLVMYQESGAVSGTYNIVWGAGADNPILKSSEYMSG